MNAEEIRKKCIEWDALLEGEGINPLIYARNELFVLNEEVLNPIEILLIITKHFKNDNEKI